MRILALSLLTAVLVVPPATLGAAEIHVSPKGNDANPGAAEKPLASIAAAQARARKCAGREAVTVLLHWRILGKKSDGSLDYEGGPVPGKAPGSR